MPEPNQDGNKEAFSHETLEYSQNALSFGGLVPAGRLFLRAAAEGEASGNVEKLTVAADQAIYRYTTSNGQELYFVADAMEEPVVQMEDVNFDGTDDVVITTRMGASNAYDDFYVWDGQQYVYATPDGLSGSGLANYSLDAEKGYVLSHANNGLAGLECEVGIYRWEGLELKPVRVLRAETSSRWQDSPTAATASPSSTTTGFSAPR